MNTPKFRASYSTLNNWAMGQIDRAIEGYFKLADYSTPQMEMGKKFHKEWELEVKKTNCMPQVFGGRQLQNFKTERKIVKQITDWMELVGVVDLDIDSKLLIDFKTGKYEEKQESLQLPIYLLLVTNTQKRKVSGASYWYLNKDNKPTKQELPDEKQSFEKVYEVAKRIKLARQLQHFKCPHNGCMKCTPLERVLRGDGEKVGVSDTKQDIYILN